VRRVELSSPVVRAALLVALQAVLLAVVAVGYAVGGIAGDAESTAGSEVGAVLLGLSAALLLLVARGLLRRRAWARAPAVVVQILLGMTALSLLQAVPVAAAAGTALAVLVLFQLLGAGAQRELRPDD